MREEYSSRLSFCCAACRKRSTSLSVRFLGRRVYLALAVVLVSGSRTASTPTGVRLGAELGVARQTLQRWQAWWIEQFPLTPLWRATCARFMPPVDAQGFPGTLLERFAGSPEHSLMRLLVFLSPLTLRGGEAAAIEVFEVR
jgi:hypothetical protein